MMSDEELRAEAERLVDLDERGRLVEQVKMALRIGEISTESSRELEELDEETSRLLLDDVGRRAGAVASPLGNDN
jgi:hypothetical protein